MPDDIVVKVRENKTTGQKYVTIPMKSKVEPGDFVRIVKVVFKDEQ